MKKQSKLTISDYQAVVKERIKELGFSEETIPEVFMLLTEEVGEFAKAARKSSGKAVDKNSKVYDMHEEAADILWLLLDLCNLLGINLEEAFAKKAAKNQKRKWG